MDTPGVHPAAQAILRFFDYGHLSPELREIAKPFGNLAWQMALTLSPPKGHGGAEVTVMLRKLLEAKDCAVRAALPPGPS